MRTRCPFAAAVRGRVGGGVVSRVLSPAVTAVTGPPGAVLPSREEKPACACPAVRGDTPRCLCRGSARLGLPRPPRGGGRRLGGAVPLPQHHPPRSLCRRSCSVPAAAAAWVGTVAVGICSAANGWCGTELGIPFWVSYSLCKALGKLCTKLCPPRREGEETCEVGLSCLVSLDWRPAFWLLMKASHAGLAFRLAGWLSRVDRLEARVWFVRRGTDRRL